MTPSLPIEPFDTPHNKSIYKTNSVWFCALKSFQLKKVFSIKKNLSMTLG